MSVEREHETTVTIAGLVIPVTVAFKITAFGSSPSGYGFDGSYDPGESDEIEILSVVTEFGRDITATLAELRQFPTVAAYLQWPGPDYDPLRAALFLYETKLSVVGTTALDHIEAEILEDTGLMEPPQDDDYDPRDWE